MDSAEHPEAVGLKTFYTAVVVIPPDETWRPIQAIRARYDRKFSRWMPHITMAYPFRPKEEFDSLSREFAEACADIQPFEIELSDVRSFDHGRGSYTLWLAVKPPEPLVALQAALARVAPDCDDVATFAAGFTPHLSLGQARGEPEMTQLRDSLQASWQPLTFQVKEISLVCRDDRPDDAFRVQCKVPLGQRGTT